VPPAPRFCAGDTETLRPVLPITQQKSDCIPVGRIGRKKSPAKVPRLNRGGETTKKKDGSGASGPLAEVGLAVAALGRANSQVPWFALGPRH
jgi:hypothetical protein